MRESRPPAASYDTLLLQAEHATILYSFRQAALVGLIAWPSFALVDWFIVSFVATGRMWVMLLFRLAGMLPLAAAAILLRVRRRPSLPLVHALDTLTCITMVALITLASVEAEAITGALSLGVVVVLVARGALLPQSLRRSIVPVGLGTLAYPITMLLASLFSSYVSTHLTRPAELATFALQNIFMMSAAALALAGGHFSWRQSRRLFETSSLGRYKVIERIGKGGMGEVYRARDRNLERDVAIKVLTVEGDLDDRSVARFEQEARATSELTHPNTIRVFDYGVTETGVIYYAMELLKGVDLTAWVRGGPVPPVAAVDVIVQACHSLAEAHERGIVHRDIKPENIFVTEVAGRGTHVKVLDFGLAKLLERAPPIAADSGEDEPLTRVGFAVGTPSYMAPETAMGENADARTDIYSLGTVLYLLLTAQLPYSADNPRRLFYKKLNEDPYPPSTRLGKVLPGALDNVVMRAISRDPQERYPSVLAFADALMASIAHAEDRATTQPDDVSVVG